jgi:hypothetical protein
MEKKCIEFAEKHGDVWRTIIVRPGGVLSSKFMATDVIAAAIGRNLSIRQDEVAAAMASLVVNGGEDGVLVLNPRLVDMGRKILSDQTGLKE